MNGIQMKTIRMKMGLTGAEFARALGYQGKDGSLETQIRRWERGHRKIPYLAGRLTLMYDAYGIPPHFRS